MKFVVSIDTTSTEGTTKAAAFFAAMAQLGLSVEPVAETPQVVTHVVAAPSTPAAAPAQPKSTRPEFDMDAIAAAFNVENPGVNATGEMVSVLFCKAEDHDAECWGSLNIPTIGGGTVARGHAKVILKAHRGQFQAQGLMSGACFTAGKTSRTPSLSAKAQGEAAKPTIAPASTTIQPNVAINVTTPINPSALLAAMAGDDDIQDDNDSM